MLVFQKEFLQKILILTVSHIIVRSFVAYGFIELSNSIKNNPNKIIMHWLVVMDILLSSFNSKSKLLQFTINNVRIDIDIFIRIDWKYGLKFIKYQMHRNRRDRREQFFSVDQFRNHLFVLWHQSRNLSNFCFRVERKYQTKAIDLIDRPSQIIINDKLSTEIILGNQPIAY